MYNTDLLTTRSGQYVNSPHNFNEMSVRQVLRMKIIISLRFDFDITPNSYDYLRKNIHVTG